MRSAVVHLYSYPDAGDFSDADLQKQIAQRVEEIYALPDFSLQVVFDDLVPGATQSFGISNLQLLDDMQRCAAPSPQPDWFARVLLAHSSDRGSSTLGILFDTENRQGCAVFTNSLRQILKSFDRLLIHTLAHEIGHVFNLTHEDGDDDPIMSTALPIPGGVDNFSSFCGSHLSTHDPSFVQPGKCRFGVRSCPGHFGTDIDPNLTVGRRKVLLRLHVHPGAVYPQTSVPTFVLGEPLHISLELINGLRRPLLFPHNASTADQSLLLLRSADTSFENLRPPLLVCGNGGRARWRRLDPGDSVSFHETLTYRNGGPVFPQEGKFRLVAGLRLREGLLWSNTQSVRVAPPLKQRHERACSLAVDPQAGLFVELGGASHLGTAQSSLSRLTKSHRDFPLNKIVRLLLARHAVISPARTPENRLSSLRDIAADKRLPSFVREEARLLLKLERFQQGERSSAATLRRRLEPATIPSYPAALIRRRLDEITSSTSEEESA